MSYECYLPQWLGWFASVPVEPTVAATLVYGPVPPRWSGRRGEDSGGGPGSGGAPVPGSFPPGAPPQGRIPLTFRVARRPIASRWLPSRASRAILTCTFFSEPVTISCAADFPRRRRGWMRMMLSAVAATDAQAADLITLVRDEPDIPVVPILQQHLGLGLGHHWIEVTADVNRLIGFDDAEARAVAADFCAQVSSLIVRGPRGHAATRILESIPGIRGERAEA